jgi:hypothetical protein
VRAKEYQQRVGVRCLFRHQLRSNHRNLFQHVDYIDQDGVEVKGRGEMEKLFMENFQANPGAKIAITIEEVKPLTPDVGPSGVMERNPELRIRFRYSRQSKFWGGFDPLPRWMIFLLCSAVSKYLGHFPEGLIEFHILIDALDCPALGHPATIRATASGVIV